MAYLGTRVGGGGCKDIYVSVSYHKAHQLHLPIYFVDVTLAAACFLSASITSKIPSINVLNAT